MAVPAERHKRAVIETVSDLAATRADRVAERPVDAEPGQQECRYAEDGEQHCERTLTGFRVVQAAIQGSDGIDRTARIGFLHGCPQHRREILDIAEPQESRSSWRPATTLSDA